MRSRIVIIDAFADRPFEGNPAAVVPLERWPPDALLGHIAQENAQPMTAFLVPQLPREAPPAPAGLPAHHLRWFKPDGVEAPGCGHATLAAGALLLEELGPDVAEVAFWTKAGWLTVARGEPGQATLSFPSAPLEPVPVDPVVEAALGAEIVETYFDGLRVSAVLADQDAVATLEPDLAAIATIDVFGVAVTAPGDDDVDFVLRFFAPRQGIPEDPVTGSATAALAPYWAQRLSKRTLRVRQLSPRDGALTVALDGDRALLTGGYRRYLDGEIVLSPRG